jgi:hypothetical protein
MDIGSILLIAAMFILVAAYVLEPLRSGRARLVSEQEQEFSALLAERERLLTALLELDFDHQLGKVPEEIYPAQRSNLMERAASVLRRLDELKGESGGAEERLEAAIAARRADSGEDAEDDRLEAMIASRKQSQEKKGRQGGFCQNCGEKVIPGDRFCSKCGAAQSGRGA